MRCSESGCGKEKERHFKHRTHKKHVPARNEEMSTASNCHIKVHRILIKQPFKRQSVIFTVLCQDNGRHERLWVQATLSLSYL